MKTLPGVAFYWQNFGPVHLDELEATQQALEGEARVVGIELLDRSTAYGWGRHIGTGFTQITLYPGGRSSPPSAFDTARKIVRACIEQKCRHVFLCHYQETHALLAAWWLRMRGVQVYVMSDSKFDDYERKLWREYAKSLYMHPYAGGIAASPRSADYLRFLGVPAERIVGGYDTISIGRVRTQAAHSPAPEGMAWEDREFVCVARLVPKKNHTMLIDAYARYAARVARPRHLHLCGDGPLRGQLEEAVKEHGLDEHVTLHGNLAPEQVAAMLGRALALLLPSTEEQFGISVLEAQAMGLPVILGENCGARDGRVRSGVEGFVVEPDNPEGMAWMMELLARDKAQWQAMAVAALAQSSGGDARLFAESVCKLTGYPGAG
ncbi:MAG: glycosyltransferase family 4 protein [Novosphingobium sp.]